MARLGLGEGWRCAFANDFDPVKAGDLPRQLRRRGDALPRGRRLGPDRRRPARPADLAWASSPCQDFSLAGARAGLAGGRSSAFFGFWRLMRGARPPRAARRAPWSIENVVGLLTSHGGARLRRPCARRWPSRATASARLEIDAAGFLPQSRPRVFVSRRARSPCRSPSASTRRSHDRAGRRAPRPPARRAAATAGSGGDWPPPRGTQRRPGRPAGARRRRGLARGRRRPRGWSA